MEFEGLQVLDGCTAERDRPEPRPGEGRLSRASPRRRLGESLGKALTDVESDAMELTLPVVPFGVKLATSKSGSIAGAGTTRHDADRRVPCRAEAGTRKLTISVTPSIAGSVFAALDYLTSYPYGCTEQTMSSFLPDVRCRRRAEETRRQVEHRSRHAAASRCRPGSIASTTTSMTMVAGAGGKTDDSHPS